MIVINMYRIVFSVAILLGPSSCQDFHVENGGGFVVDPVSPTPSTIEGEISRKEFFITDQTTATKVVATFANIRAEHNVTYDLNDYTKYKNSQIGIIHLNGANISAHLVHSTVADNEPHIEVLVHTDQRLESTQCVVVTAKINAREQVSETCLLGSAEVCLARLTLPYSWWSIGYVDVYYGLSHSTYCSTNASSTHNVGRVTLTFADLMMSEEYAEDRHVSILLPKTAQKAGAQFAAEVRLQPNSDLKVFVIKISAEDGIQLKSVRSADSTTWAILVDKTKNEATVTAFIADEKRYLRNKKTQEVLQCEFDIDKSVDHPAAEITWQIKYESTVSETLYYDDDSKGSTRTVITPVTIISADETKYLVPVLKSREMVNLKRLTEEVETLPIWLFSITSNGDVKQVNSDAACTSEKPRLLQVSRLCDVIYLSSDMEGAGLVTVRFEYERVTHSLPLRIWYPEAPSIRVADDRLNEIRGWHVREERDGEISQRCHLQHQTSAVSVYTRFYTLTADSRVYMRGNKKPVYADITHLVRSRLVSSDRSIFTVDNGVLRGESKGRANVQIVSSNGNILATENVKVASGKISVQKLQVNFYSGISIAVSKNTAYEGLLVAKFTYIHKLSSKQPEGVLDPWIQFTDKTYTRLSNYEQSDYRINIENQTPDILSIISSPLEPFVRVRAIGSGQGRLTVSLRANPLCDRKSSRVIAVANVVIDADLPKQIDKFINDAEYLQDSAVPLDWSRRRSENGVKHSQRSDGNLKSSNANSINSKAETAQSQQKSQEGMSGPLKTGMYVLSGVVGVVISVFFTNYLIYLYRQRSNKGGQSSTVVDKTASGWVWLDRETLEQNAISTDPEQLFTEKEFNRQCTRSDSLHSTKSKRSSCGTYKGSECSVRITANPLNELNDEEESEDELYSIDSHKPVISLEESDSCDEFVSDSGSGQYDIPPSRTSSKKSRHSRNSAAAVHQSLIHQELIEDFDDDPSNMEILTQEEFNNLRESIA